jgi:agmatinase
MTEGNINELSAGDIGVVGIPLDENSSFMKGPGKGPLQIVNGFHSSSANYFTESGLNLEKHEQLKWLGQLDVTDYHGITPQIAAILEKGAKPFSFGGDHSVTFPVMNAFMDAYEKISILHFDAHGDLYDELDNNRISHACPFARIMEQGRVERLVQVGIRTMTAHQQDQVDRFEVEQIHMKDWNPDIRFDIEGPVYLSFDMDVFDPAVAPGISHYEPGGFTAREVINMLLSLDLNIVGADIVELNPDRDINGMTAMLAAKVFKEIVAKML